eukprot:GFUD01035678.1.p1 GENE.GFUD01035678.1~~GFUD01035678.1.p1  ORF type:complete len:522 (+),score=132.99 GFUD01035678.1:37-1602(+)
MTEPLVDKMMSTESDKVAIVEHGPRNANSKKQKRPITKQKEMMTKTGFSNITSSKIQKKMTKPATSEADHIWMNFSDDDPNGNIHAQYATIDTIVEIETPPSIVILEQPDPSYRFRYDSEADVVAPLYGANSKKEMKTFPKIGLSNLDKNIWIKREIFVSCVTHNEDQNPRVHPYLVKNNKRKKGANCANGVCHVTLANDDDVMEFGDIGIQRVKTEQTKGSLQERENFGIDPFKRGYAHTQYDKEAVKLCFQVRLTDVLGYTAWLPPVTSNTISNAKSKVMSLHSVAPTEALPDEPVLLTILADHLPPRARDIRVVFSTPAWSKTVLPEYQHHGCAVQVLTPELGGEITERTKVEVKLVRISNKAQTEPLDFVYLPARKISQEFKLPFTNQDHLEYELTQEETSNNESEDDKVFSNSTNKNVENHEDEIQLPLEECPIDTVPVLNDAPKPDPLNIGSAGNNPSPTVNTLVNIDATSDSPDQEANLNFTFENLDEEWDRLYPEYMMPEDEPNATTSLYCHT